jgi:hypothetical protein
MASAHNAESVVAHNLEQLLYAITSEPRLFRWNGGRIQWSPYPGEPAWQVLPLKVPVGPVDASSSQSVAPGPAGALIDGEV